MKMFNITDILKENNYPGRGIIIGKSKDSKNAVIAYFIMGRSENSRNRIFVKTDDGIQIRPFDDTKVSDPSLIIYEPVREVSNDIIVTNGDQTNTVYDFLQNNKSFEEALNTRCFEPDAPNYTPRISGIINKYDIDGKHNFKYKLSILKSLDETAKSCSRYFYIYEALDGIGHFIHTYKHDGNPIPSFEGEPHKVFIPNDIESFTSDIWQSLDAENKVSLYVSFISLSTGENEYKIINKYN